MKKQRGLEDIMGDESVNKILAIAIDKGGCGWMRVRQWAKVINEVSEKTYIHLVDSNREMNNIEQMIGAFDAVWFKNGSGPLAREIHRQYQSRGESKPIIFDHDDNTYVILPSNWHYKDHGVKEVTVPLPGGEEKDLWKAGVSGFDPYRNLEARIWLEYLLRTAELVTATTPKLKEAWEVFNDNVQIVPNAIDFDYYPDVEVKDPNKKNELRIGWSGGVSHAGDFSEAGPVIANFMRDNPNAIYYSQGAFWPYFFKGVNEKRLRVCPWMEFQANPFNIKSMCLDFAVIPLQDMEFNYYKSEIKFSEFSANKVPCIVKDQLPYSPYLEDGINCLTYKTEDELYEKMEMMKDPIIRSKIIGNAYEWVKEKRDARKLAPEVEKTLTSVIKK